MAQPGPPRQFEGARGGGGGRVEGAAEGRGQGVAVGRQLQNALLGMLLAWWDSSGGLEWLRYDQDVEHHTDSVGVLQKERLLHGTAMSYAGAHAMYEPACCSVKYGLSLLL